MKLGRVWRVEGLLIKVGLVQVDVEMPFPDWHLPLLPVPAHVCREW